VWLASPENSAPFLGMLTGQRPPEAGAEPAFLLLAAAPSPSPSPEPMTRARKRWPRGGLLREIREVLPQLPEEFDRLILVRHLSGEPDPSTLGHLLGKM